MNKKILALVLALTLLVGGVVGGTVAWLVSKPAAVVNTFTVGKLEITLDETDVDEWGVPTGAAERVKANDYTLMPGRAYTKDPIVHVQKNSEKSYVFVKLEGMPKFNTHDTTKVFVDSIVTNLDAGGYGDRIGDLNVWTQVRRNGWIHLDGTDNVFYQVVEATGDKVVDLHIFDKFGINEHASAADLAKLSTQGITVTAYACQFDGFKDAVAAWANNFAK